MEIIEQLAPARRGVYGSSVFRADFSGNLDSCIAIRTLFLAGGQGCIPAGCGVVADSLSDLEFEGATKLAPWSAPSNAPTPGRLSGWHPLT